MSVQLTRSVRGACVVLALTFGAAGPAVAAEVIPSLHLTRETGQDAVRLSGGLAVRGPVVRGVLDTELGIAYRQDLYEGGDVRVHSWPITASLWFRPQRALYVGGGLGWYNTTVEYPYSHYADETTQRVGVHLGGGVRVPLSREVSMDLGGRYVFRQHGHGALLPHDFEADSWTTTLGVAVRF
ncbi:MAG: outer membrane beta-barrel protein [Candidatus Eisenbacteria bacterium]|nr:outer membrane beta-barrel protein [Candidatus Eisenbacteria bacterium]